MKKLLATVLTVVFLAGASQNAYSVDVTKNFNINLDDSQIVHSIFFNDVWLSPALDLGGVELIGPGDSLILNLNFDKKLKLNDGFFNGNESLKVGVISAAIPGGAPRTVDIEFTFTGVMGGPLLNNPVTFTNVPYNIAGHLNFDQSVDLINGGMVSFGDLHVKITNNNTNTWAVTGAQVGVDADTVSVVPEPSTYLLMGTGLAMICFLRKRYSKSSV